MPRRPADLLPPVRDRGSPRISLFQIDVQIRTAEFHAFHFSHDRLQIAVQLEHGQESIPTLRVRILSPRLDAKPLGRNEAWNGKNLVKVLVVPLVELLL